MKNHFRLDKLLNRDRTGLRLLEQREKRACHKLLKENEN